MPALDGDHYITRNSSIFKPVKLGKTTDSEATQHDADIHNIAFTAAEPPSNTGDGTAHKGKEDIPSGPE